MSGAELTVGGWVASAIIGKVVDLGRSYLGDNHDLHTETRNMLTNLENALPRIQSVIEAANERQVTNQNLERWLDQLKYAAYEAEDVLDYFEGKRIRESLKGKELKSVVNKLNMLCMDSFMTTSNIFHSDGILERSSNLSIDVTPIFGRNREIKLILDMIFNVLHGDPNLQQENGEGSSNFRDLIPRAVKSFTGLITHWLSKFAQTPIMGNAPKTHPITVIPIVGVGGIGKSFVALKIYNNERVKKHFTLTAWVYVPCNCGAKKTMQRILCSIEGGTIDSTITFENVRNKLKQNIANHRFLLILDDLRGIPEPKWRDLVSVLNYGKVGSVVVVTTQSRSIAKTIRTVPEVTLEFLQPESFWELFQYYAFGYFKLGDLKEKPPVLPSNQEELKNIGKHIAEKLYGLPVAGRVIGHLLNTRLEREYWQEILGRDWWTIEGARENILPSIAASYNYFDPQLKQCFAVCSIFPKKYVFERERLVQMWIAQGFIQPNKEETRRLNNKQIRLEDIGRKWFDKLVDELFCRPTSSDGKYLMHDLARDLAIAVSSNEFCFVKSHNENVSFLARHVGIGCDTSEVEWRCMDSKRLRTLILFDKWTNCSAKSISSIFPKYNVLRVLNLSHIELETNTLIAVCQLSHLRFVDLSFTGIKSIPDNFCNLCHLEVLDVRGCNFEKLPKGMNKLIKLRHLYASSDTISLISSIGKLTKLQELEEFRIGDRKGHGISELINMNEISGHLLLSNLNNVSSKEEAAKCQLDKKIYLKSLELRFENNDRGPRTKVKMEVLDALQPASNLEILKVGGCRWDSFPSWMFSPHHGFNNLKVIHVYCFWLSNLPAFGELPSLEILSFVDLPLIEKVGNEFYGSSDVIFPSLKELTFSRMSSWRDWSDAEAEKTIFPHLKKLHLEQCRVLKELPTGSFKSSVVEFILSGCPDLWLSNLPAFGEFPSLEILSFVDLPSITEVGSEFYGSSDVIFPSLKKLTFSRIPTWTKWSDAEAGKTIFPILKMLHLEQCSVLEELPTKCFTSSVVELKLLRCPELRNIETVLQGMPSLAHLSIKTEVSDTLSICCTHLNFIKDMHLEVMYPENMGRADMIQLCFVRGLQSLANLRNLVLIGFSLESCELEENEEQSLQLTYLYLCPNKFNWYCTPSTSHIFPRIGRSMSSLSTLLLEYSPVENYTRDEESWFQQLTSLENLEFRNCLMLRCLPSALHLLTSLKKLQIYNCPRMISLPNNGLPQNLAELHINKCPDLISLCKPNQGADHHMISRIRLVTLDGEMITTQVRSP